MSAPDGIALVRDNPRAGDQLLVGGNVPWSVDGREGEGSESPVRVVIRYGSQVERKTLKIGQWRRIAARAAVVVQGRAYLPGVAPAPAGAAGPTENDDREAGCLCHGCGRRYLVDLVVPDELWDRIRPDPSRDVAAGLLCPRCIGARLEALGQPAAFTLARTA